MSIVTVKIDEAFKRDYAKNEDKFYRTYVIGDRTLFQWGRRGVVGQFKWDRWGTDAAASSAARKKFSSKVAEGYTHERTYDFEVNDTLLQAVTAPGKREGESLDRIRLAKAVELEDPWADPSNYPGHPDYDPWRHRPTEERGARIETIEVDKLEAFTQRALAAIGTAATQPQTVAETYAKLNAELPDLQEMFERATSYMDTLGQLIALGGAA